MIRTKGEAGTGDVVEAVRHMRAVQDAIRKLQTMPDDELVVEARDLSVSLDLLQQTREQGRLPVVNFAAGGVATPADAALMMQLGADGVFRRLRHFQVRRPGQRAPTLSCRPSLTITTLRSSPKCPRTWASRWLAATSARSPRASCWLHAACSLPGVHDFMAGWVLLQLAHPI